MEKVSASALELQNVDLRRYADGAMLSSRKLGETAGQLYGSPWMYVGGERAPPQS